MNPVVFSLKSRFPPPLAGDANVLSDFGGAELALFALAKRSQTVHRRPDIASLSAGIGIPEMLKAPLAKSAIRSKATVFIFQIGSKASRKIAIRIEILRFLFEAHYKIFASLA